MSKRAAGGRVIAVFDNRGSTSAGRWAFTLIELLVVVSIIALLLALLLPGHRRARMQARIVVAHADLRNISVALDAYALDNRDALPPARSGCGARVNYQLPVELATDQYLPRSPGSVPQAQLQDVFNPKHTYKYRAPGPIWFNGSFFDDPESTWRPRANIWVPDDFPHCRSEVGRYYANRTGEPPSPATYAVWSVGPNPRSAKLPRHEGSDQVDESKLPLPQRFWLMNSGDTGLITYFRCRTGVVRTSP